jgi:LETM1 and EF-hand domain-containing protein 1, mitochondrial
LIINQKNTNFIHLSSHLCKEPDSKVDKAFDILKEEETPTASPTAAAAASPIQSSSIVPRPTLWQRIVAECKHYYHGFKLLYFETKITIRLLREVLKGHTLTRRERKQLTQTAADLFRLVPFSLFIIVPFLEFTLPIFLKLFPNMLPSTFKEQSQEVCFSTHLSLFLSLLSSINF